MESFKNIKTSLKLLLYFTIMILISTFLGYFSNIIFKEKTVNSILLVIFTVIILVIISYFLTNNEVTKPIEEANEVLNKMANNDYTVEVKGNYSGTMRELALNVNDVRLRFLSIQGICTNISNGDISDLEKLEKIGKRSEKDKMIPDLIKMIKSIKDICEEIEVITNSAMNGDIHIHGQEDNFKGNYKTIVRGINNLLDTLVAPLQEAITILDRMAVNDFTLEMEGEYKGSIKKFAQSINDVKTRLLSVQDGFVRVAKGDTSRLEEFKSVGKRSENDKLVPACIATMQAIHSLINESKMLASSAINGQLDVRGNDDQFEGSYKEIILGINNMLDSAIAPVKEASNVLGEMEKGNFKARMNGNYKGDHAVIKNALNNTMDSIGSYIDEISSVLIKMAEGNIDVTISRDYVGDFIEIKNSLNEIINSFNKILNDMNTSSQQVASGARQVSDSAQALSQGSTEQASSVEELTASLEEIAAQTKQNAENAEQANKMALAAKDNALNGNIHMQEMLKSINEINEASSNISKIIKVIDDIAFQTNILALNAAVEAARAGQQGKGFAVVAEEVRNLAARSANAAKETTALIESSIKKAENGTQIADDTAEALNKIVDAVSDATSLVSEIARASNEQAAGISQINDGIMQVSQVVQTNSATAEESAAASEELSSQAEILKGLVNGFKLKKGNLDKYEVDKINPQVLKMLENMSVKQNEDVDDINSEFDKHKFKIDLSDGEFGKY